VDFRDFSYLYDSDNDEIPDCDITVYYCYIVEPTGELKYEVDELKVDIPCGITLLGEVNFWGDLELRLMYHIVATGTFDPCPLSAFNVKILRAKCWKIENDPSHDQVLVKNCGYTAYCEWRYKICWDSDLGRNVYTFLETISIGTPDCPGEMPMLPPLNNTWDDEWTTNCYGISCP